jgi:hypothetical protein
MKITLEVVYGSKRTIREAVRAAGAGPQDVESVLEPFGAHCRAGSYGIRLEKYESNLKYQVETLEFDENHGFRLTDRLLAVDSPPTWY